MKDKVSTELDLVQEILTGLAKLRMEVGAWLDSESEELERETQAFKIGECLRPFYLAAREYPDQFTPSPLPRDILFKDTEFFFKAIEKQGFFPSPYSPIPGATDQYTDFAAFILDFCTLTYDFWQHDPRRGRRLMESSKSLAERAFQFLIKPENILTDEDGCRWGGTSRYSRVKKAKELYTDTYFTSVVLLALHTTLEHPMLALSTAQQDEVRNLIRQAGRWIADRFDGQFITGDEANTNRRLVYTTWGLRALVESFHGQEQNTRKVIPSLTNAYLTVLQSRLTREGFTLEQEYFTILSEEVDAPLYYEDRSGLGGILLTLTSLRSIIELESLLEELQYTLIFERTLSAIMTLRNQPTGLWYRQGLILSIHSYLVEAFIMLNRRGKAFGRKLEVSGHMVRTAVREAFADESIIASLQQAVHERLLRLVEGVKQDRTVEEGMRKLRSVPSQRKGTRGSGSKGRQSRSKSRKK